MSFFFFTSFAVHVHLSEGEMTGVCVNSTKTCEVLAWCPVENDLIIPEYVEMLHYFGCKTHTQKKGML